MALRTSLAALALAACAHGAAASPAQDAALAAGYKQLYSFQGLDGRRPLGRLLENGTKVLFGTTADGGTHDLGTIFKLTKKSGLLKTVQHFAGDSYAGGGEHPLGGLIGHKRFYTTTSGKPSRVFDTNADGSHDGTTFKLDPKATGYAMTGSLVRSLVESKMYGATQFGGKNDAGAIFWFESVSTHQVVAHTFSGPDGAQPQGALLATAEGDLYGSTKAGGAHGLGTLFRLARNGAFASLHSFDANECSSPKGDLVRIGDKLFGVCSEGGLHGAGALFRLAGNGTLTILHHFGDSAQDGAQPLAGLTLGAAHDVIYGTTSAGGEHGAGTVFRMTPQGELTILYSFCDCDGDGREPSAPLLLGADGKLYGTTAAGGKFDDNGTVFVLDAP